MQQEQGWDFGYGLKGRGDLTSGRELESARDIGLWACGLVGLWISFKILHVARLMKSSMISATSSMDALFF